MIKFPQLKTKLILAPMHNVTNLPFRIMCKKYGASLVSTELLSANALSRKNKRTMDLAKTSNDEKPVSLQMFSQNTENIVKSAVMLQKDFDIIDINLGCPSKKILSQGSGGALLRRKNKIYEIVSEVVKSVQIPVTVKIRSGYDKYSINAVEIAKICEEAGASAIIIHARTVEQGYSGKADWEIIKEVKENVKIPVIGNGDVLTCNDAKKMFDETKCDYIMIGRGAIGNPFIFKQINHFLETKEIIKQSNEEKIRDLLEYIKISKSLNMINKKDVKMKAQEFTKGLPGSSKLRLKISKMKEIEEIIELIKEGYNPD